jgi:predicted AlkP superfamily pyrophosphatase or phosphodiesterase
MRERYCSKTSCIDDFTRWDEAGIRHSRQGAQPQAPVLERFLAEGTYAEGVVGVVPTVTYPSHSTLVTGVWPAEHGVHSNLVFDPLGEYPGEWYWYFREIKAHTLYQAADEAGLTTAAVSWPVTAGAPIDYLITEFAAVREDCGSRR